MTIDMHAHWSPRRLISESAAGRDWYGWRILRDATGREHVTLGSRVLRFAASKSTLDDPAARAAGRKKVEGIDLEALILTGTFWNYHLDEADATRFCREVNEEVAEVQRAYPDRFRGMALLPMQHPKAALRALDDATGRLGLTTIAIATNVRGRNLDDPTVLPILEAAAAMKVSICVHPTIWDKAGDDRFPRYYFWNSFGAPLESSLAAMSVVYGGLLDRYPDIRIMFTQGGGWIHFGVGRFDLRYRTGADGHPMEHPPADYLSRLHYDCLVHDADSLALLAKRAGTDRIMLGTDYPAGGDIVGGAARWIAGLDFLSAEDKEKILWRNATGFLGIKQLAAAEA